MSNLNTSIFLTSLPSSSNSLMKDFAYSFNDGSCSFINSDFIPQTNSQGQFVLYEIIYSQGKATTIQFVPSGNTKVDNFVAQQGLGNLLPSDWSVLQRLQYRLYMHF